MMEATLPWEAKVQNLLPPLSEKIVRKWRQALQVFEEADGRTHGDIFTDTQIQIVDIIAKRRFPRTQLILPTQYGKSASVADGVLMRISEHEEKWAIVAPTADKAKIIMDYIIEHIFDDPLLAERLEYYGSKEQLKAERSKNRITLRDGGEVRVYTASAGNSKAVKKALMGFGAPNIILDESSQLPDDVYATVKRMLGGTKDNFLLEIGNPSFRNHFYRTWIGSRYRKIFVDCYQALREGRYTQDFIDEMREEAGFEWMYECKFPDADAILPSGYRRLLTSAALEKAFVDNPPEFKMKRDKDGNILKNKWGIDIIDDEPVLGIDPAGSGSNKTAYCIRFPKHNILMKLAKVPDEDPNVQADKAEEYIKKYTVTDYRIGIDAGGVGHGLAYEMEKRGYLVQKVLFGESKENGNPIDRGFRNIKAVIFWRLRTWILAGGNLLRDEDLMELGWIAYKQNSSLKVQMEPKEDMIKRKSEEGSKVESPDTADASALTFVDTQTIVDEDDIDFD